LCPVIAALASPTSAWEPFVVVTGQHREMLDQVLGLFGVKPQVDLAIMRPGQSLNEILLRAVEGVTSALHGSGAEVLIVQGDTTSAMAAGLVGFHEGVPVVHVEAGLRSDDLHSPYPEEFNRRVLALASDLHLAPTSQARDRLLTEGIDESAVHIVGNTGIDALHWAVAQPDDGSEPLLAELERDARPVVLVTAHRRESWGEPMQRIAQALALIAEVEPETLIVLPAHRNPVVREVLMPAVRAYPNVRVVEPLAYGAFSRLLARATILLTDSGGIQEEGPALGKPVLVLRESTERPEGVAAGAARLVGTSVSRIVLSTLELLHDGRRYAEMAVPRNVYGDGHAAARCVDAMTHRYAGGSCPGQFVPDLEARVLVGAG
jgi:UDP-N-acetylglucosamine 2-epimerase (non-hydrolysing)